MTSTTHFALAPVGPVASGPARVEGLTTRAHGLLARLRAAGRRCAPLAATGQALVSYWTFVAEAALDERRALVRALQDGPDSAGACPRAWVPVALGEPDFELALAATHGHLGGWPASVERRLQAEADVIDWILRSLALNRAALYFALLDGADEEALERLAPLRGRLTAAESGVVLAACARSARRPLLDFADAWRARLP